MVMNDKINGFFIVFFDNKFPSFRKTDLIASRENKNFHVGCNFLIVQQILRQIQEGILVILALARCLFLQFKKISL